MQVSVEKTDSLERRMTVEIPAEGYENSVKSKLKSLASTVKLKGFRPGKVPIGVVEKKFGGKVREEAFNEIVQSSLYEALVKEDLRPAGSPSIERLPVEDGQGLRYIATFEVYPVIELASYTDVKIEKPIAEVTDKDIDNEIEQLRTMRVQWTPVDRASKIEDKLELDFIGTINGTEFEGGSAKKVPLVLGSNSMIPGFEDQLVGVATGEEKIIEMPFPDDYHVKDLAGKPAQFAITVHSVMESVLPELDAEFIKGFGVNDGSIDTFRNEVKKNMQHKLDQAINERISSQVTDAMIEKNPIELPKATIDNEARALAEQMRNNLVSQGMANPDESYLKPELFEAQARRRVALGLIMSMIASDNEIKADAEAVKEKVAALATTYQKPDEVVNWYYSNKERLSEIEAMVVEGKVVDWFMDQVQISEKPVTFDALTRPEQPGTD